MVYIFLYVSNTVVDTATRLRAERSKYVRLAVGLLAYQEGSAACS